MNTWLGLFAIVIWSASVGVSRSLTEKLGTFTTPACIYLLSGVLGTGFWVWNRKRGGKPAPLSMMYWTGCGFLFVFYSVCLYMAIGLAAGRQQAIEVGLINYLWPTLTLVFSIPILKKQASGLLALGAILSLGGIGVATAQQGALTWECFLLHLRSNATPYVFALLAALSWALYSNLAKRWGGEGKGDGVPLFLLATGVLLGGVRVFFSEAPQWTSQAVVELVFLALFPGLLGYLCWERAMRRGNLTLVVSFSNLTPLLSTVVSCLYLRVAMGAPILIACGLVILGALLCRKAIRDTEDDAHGSASASP